MPISWERLQKVTSGYYAKVDSLTRQELSLDITANERKVFQKRAREEAKAALLYEAKLVGGELLTRFKSPDTRAADDFRKSYWDPANLDEKAVNMHAEQIARKLARIEDHSMAAALVNEAMTGPKEQTYALWRAAPEVLKQNRDSRIQRLSERCEKALIRRMADDPEYQAAIQKQNGAYEELRAGVNQLKSLVKTDIGGATGFEASPLGGLHPYDTAAAVSDYFEAASSTVNVNMEHVPTTPYVAFYQDPTSKGKGDPTHVVKYHAVETGNTGGVF